MTQPTQTRSWVASANGHADFPLQNLPLGVFTFVLLFPFYWMTITTFKGKGIVPDDHPLGCGVLGRSGIPVASLPMAVPVNVRSDSDPAGGNRFAGVNIAAVSSA